MGEATFDSPHWHRLSLGLKSLNSPRWHRLPSRLGIVVSLKESVIFPSPAGFAITDGFLLEALGCTSLGIWKPRDLSQPSVFLSTYEG